MMPENRQAKRNGCISGISHPTGDDIEVAIRRLKIQTNDKQDEYSPYPDRPGEPDCIYYLRTGMCGYGSNCRFHHPSYFGQFGQLGGEFPERIGQPDCGYFLKTGTCKYGSTCKYHHPRDRHGAAPVLLNILGLPIRQDEKSCSYYMRTGTCKYGMACKFDHPQPSSSNGTVLPAVAGPTSGMTIMPSSDLAYTGGVPGGGGGWSLARAATYFPRSQGTQTYMPLVFSSSQPIPPPPQGWNTYMGSMSPAAGSTNVLGESGGFHGQIMHHQISNINNNTSLVTNLPERPDQPECRYFMSTGHCKFGSNCKYHHPREKTAQLATSSLGPLGLPLRPGQAICSYYNMYGLCKYGPTCKFDHPVLGYSYNYSMNLPTLSVLDPSTFSYHQKSSPAAHLSEISPSKSSKFTDCNRKRGGSATKKNPKSDTKISEDSLEQAADASPLDSLELLKDQSE